MNSPENIPAKTGMNPFKKKLLIAVLVIDFFIFVPIVWFFVFVPSGQIKSLENHFVSYKFENEKVTYKIVSKKPKNWVSFKDINYTAAHAIVVSEDWAFYNHSGYDMNQIKDAVSEATQGGRKRGASTISQQLVKNLFFTNQRSLHRKFKELASSIVLERNLTKERILETYLNVVEFAPGVYGIHDAAKFYFGKKPKDLTAKEGAFLAMLLPNPKRNMESFKQGKLTDFGKKTVNQILDKMVISGYLKKEQVPALRKVNIFKKNNRKNSKNKRKLDSTLLSSLSNSKSKKRKNRKPNFEVNYRSDKALQLSDEPEFDEDAILDDNSGFQEEFKAD